MAGVMPAAEVARDDSRSEYLNISSKCYRCHSEQLYRNKRILGIAY
jgi:hypothetical protein